MNEKLTSYLNGIFARYEEVQSVTELKADLLADLQECFNELKAEGKDDVTAFQMTIDSIGDIEQTVREAAGLSRSPERQLLIEPAFTTENLAGILKAVLEGCVLQIIGRGHSCGYEITRRLNALGFADVVAGTVYTILIRLEKSRLVEISKKTTDRGPSRKFFALNDAGRRELGTFWEKWEFVSSKIKELKEEI